jgi:DNA-binding CsgD family transcriptional regulator
MPMPMVGRAPELDELGRAWSGCVAERAGPRTVVITGGAGLGKSLLVATALAGLNPRPRGVLAGAARLHAPAPYDWLAAVLSNHSPDALAGPDGLAVPDGPAGPDALAGAAPEPATPAVASGAPVAVPADALAWFAQDPDAQRERYAPGALLRMAVRTVRTLVGDGPAVMVVEDLHALDPASLNLVAELAAAPDLPALLVVTSRLPDAALSPQLAARTLARLTGAPGAIRQHLGPLTAAQVGAILAEIYPDSGVSPAAVSAVWQRTGGNPYWLRELLATAGPVGPDELAAEPLPEHVRLDAHHVHPRAADLTARELDVLTCLAAGMSNKQVARSLGISPRTVTVHVSNLLRKTRSASRTEAALWAVRRQLASPM